MAKNKIFIKKQVMLFVLTILFPLSYSIDIYQIELPSEYLSEDYFENEDIEVIEYDDQSLYLPMNSFELSHEKRFYSLGNVIIGIQIHVIESTHTSIPELELIKKYNKKSYTYIPIGLKCSAFLKPSTSKKSIIYKVLFQVVNIQTWTKAYLEKNSHYETIFLNTENFSSYQSKCKDNRYTTNINKHLQYDHNDII